MTQHQSGCDDLDETRARAATRHQHDAGSQRFDHQRRRVPHPDPYAAYGPDRLRGEADHQPTPLAAGRRGRAAGTRSERFNPWGVWCSVILGLLACVAGGLGIIAASWPVILASSAALACAGVLAWAFGILNDTR
jgi:hypothetical protein